MPKRKFEVVFESPYIYYLTVEADNEDERVTMPPPLPYPHRRK